MRDNLFFINCLKQLNIDISDNQLNQFEIYYDYLVECNSSFNLTAITEYEEVYIKHFLDSISIVRLLDMNGIESLIDIGTGAGFPGIPIKIMFPHIKVTLLDSLNKRINFLNSLCNKLGLDNISAIHGRAEDFGKDTMYREQYDLAVSRAVANLSSLSEFCIPFVKVGGYFVAYKSEKTDDELSIAKNAIDLLGCHYDEVVSFKLYDNERTFIPIKKDVSTPDKYPRKAGIPIKRPL